VGLAAAFGARNVDNLQERQRLSGTAALLTKHDAGLEKTLKAEETTADDKAAAETARQALAPRLEAARAAAATIPKEAIPAGDRLSGWFEHNGLPFLAGVLLIALGGLLARKQARNEAAAMTPSGGQTRAIDFGEKLETTAKAVHTLHQLMAGATARSVAALEPFKAQVEVISRDDIEALVDTRPQVINRYGIAGFAAIFGPLSGAERALNRAWVAMVDRHWDEAQSSLLLAATRLDETRAEVARLAGTAPFGA
jgi:hypothetical protein